MKKKTDIREIVKEMRYSIDKNGKHKIDKETALRYVKEGIPFYVHDWGFK